MKLTPPALFSATKSDFTEWTASFKLFKVREAPDFISGFTLSASSSRGVESDRIVLGGAIGPNRRL